MFALGNVQIPHEFFAFILIMDVGFLVIEARRWSLFSFSRNRVLMLERGFFGSELLGDVDSGPLATPNPWPQSSSWKVQLKRLMLAPTQHVERVTWGGIYVRLTRQYGYLFIAVYIGWCFKLYEQRASVNVVAWGASVTAVAVILAAIVVKFRPIDGGLGLVRSGAN